MESLARNGLRTVLFTRVPTKDELAAAGGLVAFGIASHARSFSPAEMERTTRGDFERIKSLGAPIVHYKVCSTFDSSPTIGSIGRAIDVGADVFGTKCVPVVAGAPALGRYCAFGNLFARGSGEANPIRLDRHPNMSRHPVTPMNEADLRLHLAKQTDRAVGLLDLTQLAGKADEVAAKYEQLAAHVGVALVDYLDANQTLRIGALLLKHAQREQRAERPLF
ncbi:four-carbon acid sugar kinase family protein, partial [bacterium]